MHVGQLEGLCKAGAQTLVLGRENFADARCWGSAGDQGGAGGTWGAEGAGGKGDEGVAVKTAMLKFLMMGR